ncbi:MAG: YIP1 family protein [Candidatus Krumholzibacteria bacterium]|nr:YIP1 family protein [Candidatus Krumholzibacteria bacterium]
MNDNPGRIPEEMEEISPSGEGRGGFGASLIDIFIDPVKVFRRIKAGLPWWQPFSVVAIVIAVISYFQIPINKQILLLNEKGVSAEQLQTQGEMMDKFSLIGVIAAPLVVLLIYVILAALCNVAANLVSGKSSFKKMLSLLGFTAFVGLVEQGLKMLILHMRGIENITSHDDLYAVSFSLTRFVESDGILRAVLESFSIFQIWFLILFIIGVSVVYETDRKTAIVPTIVIWVLGVLGIMLQGLGG